MNNRVRLGLNFERFGKSLPVRVRGKLYHIPQSKLFTLLVEQHPAPTYFKGNSFELNLPKDFIDGLETISITLENDIVPRLSLASQAKFPIIFHRPAYDENRRRIIIPQVVYLPVAQDPQAEKRYSVLDKAADLKLVNEETLKSKNIPGTIGIGSFGAVFPVAGTVTTEDPKSVYKTHKERALKVFIHQPDGSNEFEAISLLRAGHLGAKSLGEDLENFNYLLQRRAGVNLWDICTADREGTNPLTIKQRYELSINFLKAIHYQIHRRGFVSRDVKPQNALSDTKRPNHVLSSDFGLTKNLLSKDKSVCGSPMYMSPEVIQAAEDIDEKADVFSAGMSLTYLWRAIVSYEDGAKIVSRRALSQKEILIDWFVGIVANRKNNNPIYTVTRSEKQQIERVINGMLIYDPTKRSSLEVSIEELQLSYIDYCVRIGEIDEAQKASVIAALKLGKQLENKLATIARPHECLYERLCELLQSPKLSSDLTKTATDLKLQFEALDQLFIKFEQEDKPPTSELVNGLTTLLEQMQTIVTEIEVSLKVPVDPSEKLRRFLLENIEQLEDNRPAIKIFVNELEIQAWANCQFKSELQESVNEIINQYQINLASLKALWLSPALDDQQKQRVKDFYNNIILRPITIDSLVDCNKKIAAFSKKIAYEADYQVKKAEYDKFYAITERALRLSERLERSLAFLPNPSAQDAEDHIKNLKFADREVGCCLKKYASMDYTKMTVKAFNDWIADYDADIKSAEIAVGKVMKDLHSASGGLKDGDRKQLLLVSLEMKINQAETVEDLKAIYDLMQKDPYCFLRKERNWFRSIFQEHGTTSSWCKAISMLQAKGYALFYENYNITAEQNVFLQKLFSEKQKRYGSGKPYLEVFESKRILSQPGPGALLSA